MAMNYFSNMYIVTFYLVAFGKRDWVKTMYIITQIYWHYNDAKHDLLNNTVDRVKNAWYWSSGGIYLIHDETVCIFWLVYQTLPNMS